MKKGWLDNYGKVENANDSNVSFSENYVGLGNDTKGRKFSPAWGGQFEEGGEIVKAQDGLKTVSTTSPEYKQLYENRQIGRWLDNNTFDSQVPLDEVVVRGNDERVLEGMRSTRQGFLEGVGTAMSFPQQEMMRMVTGKRQSPSEAWGFDTTNNSWYHPKSISNFAMDAILDPTNLVGVGLVDDVSRAAVRGVARTARNEPIQQFARTAGSPDKVVFDLMDESIDPFAETLKNIKIDNTPSSFAEDIKREALEYQQLTRDPRYLERVQRIDQDFGSKLEPLLNSFNSSVAEDSGKFFPFNISIEDEIIDPTHGSVMGVAGLTEAGSKKLKKQKEPSFWPFNRNRNSLQIDPATDRYVKISERAHVKDGEPVRGTVHHELKHHWTNSLLDADNQNYGQGLKSFIAPRSSVVSDPRNFDANRDYTYLSTPTEVDAHLMTNIRDEMVKRNYLKDHFDELSETKLDDFLSKEKDYRGLQEYFNPGREMIFDRSKFVDFFNKYGLPSTVIGGVLGGQAIDQQKNGGITKDNRGYWNPDNWEKPVEIDSNDITMEGVYEPLLGISDTGDTKLMEPGKNYKFKGKKVTEFPIARLGINQLDAQPMKKLNQLTNFTNNPDKTNWLDKYN
jgi:hypothetical protein